MKKKEIPFLYDLKGAFDFFDRKIDGAGTFLTKKMTGPMLFLMEKMTGQTLFLAEITFTAFLFLMLSCLTLDAECVICLDIVQFTANHHYA